MTTKKKTSPKRSSKFKVGDMVVLKDDQSQASRKVQEIFPNHNVSLGICPVTMVTRAYNPKELILENKATKLANARWRLQGEINRLKAAEKEIRKISAELVQLEGQPSPPANFFDPNSWGVIYYNKDF